MYFIKNVKAFSAVEITIATIVVGLFAALTLPKLPAVVENQKVSAGKKILYDLYSSQKRHFLNHGNYASSLADLDINLKSPVGFTLGVSNNIAQLASLQRANNSYTLSVNSSGSVGCSGNGCDNISRTLCANNEDPAEDHTNDPAEDHTDDPANYKPPRTLSTCTSTGCPPALDLQCGKEIKDNCGNDCGTGTYCTQGLECQKGECICVPAECPAVEKTQCGEKIIDNCGNKCGTGTYCTQGLECTGSECKEDEPDNWLWATIRYSFNWAIDFARSWYSQFKSYFGF